MVPWLVTAQTLLASSPKRSDTSAVVKAGCRVQFCPFRRKSLPCSPPTQSSLGDAPHSEYAPVSRLPLKVFHALPSHLRMLRPLPMTQRSLTLSPQTPVSEAGCPVSDGDQRVPSHLLIWLL